MPDKPKPTPDEPFIIDSESFIIDPDAPEDEPAYVYQPDSTQAAEVHMEDTSGIVEGPQIRNWKASTQPLDTREHKYAGVVPPGTLRICKRTACNKFVTPSKNKGTLKIFCSAKCAHSHHSKMSDRRRRKGGWALEVDKQSKEPIVFNRIKSTTEELAHNAYLVHLEKGICPLTELLDDENEWQGRCPGRFNQYSCTHPTTGCTCRDKAPRCLVYATLVDDMKEHWAKRDGLRYIRQFTTNGGRWVDYSELEVHIEPEKGLLPDNVKGY